MSKKQNDWLRCSFMVLSVVALASTLPLTCGKADAHMAPINDGGHNGGGGHRRRHHRHHNWIDNRPLGPDVPEPRRYWPTNNNNDNGGKHPDDPNHHPDGPNNPNHNPNHDPNVPRPDQEYTGAASGPPDYRHDWRGWNRDWDHRWVNNWGSVWNDSDVTYDVHHYRRVNDVTNNDVTNNVVQNRTPQQETWTASITKPGQGIPNFHEVHPWLFRGGQPSESGLQQLYDSGVRTVVNLRSDPRQVESERQLCARYGLKYVNIPLSTTAAPSDAQIDQFMAIVDKAAQRPDGGSVFVHCHYGADRTGAMVALYRELHDNWTFAKAHQEMLSYGFHDNLVKLKSSVAQNAATKTSSN